MNFKMSTIVCDAQFHFYNESFCFLQGVFFQKKLESAIETKTITLNHILQNTDTTYVFILQSQFCIFTLAYILVNIVSRDYIKIMTDFYLDSFPQINNYCILYMSLKSDMAHNSFIEFCNHTYYTKINGFYESKIFQQNC